MQKSAIKKFHAFDVFFPALSSGRHYSCSIQLYMPFAPLQTAYHFLMCS